MSPATPLIVGEHRRLYDDRYRIALPTEFVEAVGRPAGECMLAKERDGCLGLWNLSLWNHKVEGRMELVRKRLELDLLERDLAKLQRFTRLLSTRARPVKLGQRGRLLVPEGFRQFLDVQPESEVLLVGAGVCVEIWNPEKWRVYLHDEIGEFNTLFDELAGG